MAKLKVGMIGYEYPPYVLGGLGTYTKGLVSELKNLCNLYLFLPFKQKIKKVRVVPLNMSKKEIEIIKKKYNLWVVMKYNKNVVKLINQYSVDLVNVHDWITASAGVKIKKRYNIPLVHTVHSTQLGRPSKKRYPLKTKIERLCFEKADRIITISKKMKKELMSLYKVDSKKIRVIYNCVDVNRFKRGKEKNYILFVGRFSERKGTKYLIKAMALVKEKITDAKLKMIGTGETFEDCKKLTKKLGLLKNIEFLGWVDEKKLINAYAHASIIALPSTYEPFGLTVLEGMASGKATITTNISGASEIIENWKNGVVVKAKNVNELANAIIKLLKNDKLRKIIGKNAYKLAKKYTWKKAANETIKVFKEVQK